MDEALTCPDCQARAQVFGDFLVCQGPQDVTDRALKAGEQALKRAAAHGRDTESLDDALRALQNQKTCGKRWNRDGSPLDLKPEGTADGRLEPPSPNGWR